jgi:hypothetical protein
MRFEGTESWSVHVDRWNHLLECALWFRAAERIEVPADEIVPGPPEVEPLPAPSPAPGLPLADGWSWWWRHLLIPAAPPDLAVLGGFGPPDFGGLASHPALRDVVAARWHEATEWHSARKRTGIAEFLATRERGGGREGAVVRAVEAEIGEKAAPFAVRIIVLPVRERRIRSVGQGTFLVPERVYAGGGYDEWLHGLVRALA